MRMWMIYRALHRQRATDMHTIQHIHMLTFMDGRSTLYHVFVSCSRTEDSTLTANHYSCTRDNCTRRTNQCTVVSNIRSRPKTLMRLLMSPLASYSVISQYVDVPYPARTHSCIRYIYGHPYYRYWERNWLQPLPSVQPSPFQHPSAQVRGVRCVYNSAHGHAVQ